MMVRVILPREVKRSKMARRKKEKNLLARSTMMMVESSTGLEPIHPVHHLKMRQNKKRGMPRN